MEIDYEMRRVAAVRAKTRIGAHAQAGLTTNSYTHDFVDKECHTVNGLELTESRFLLIAEKPK